MSNLSRARARNYSISKCRGKYRARLYLPTGKRISKVLPTREQAEAWALEQKAAIAAGKEIQERSAETFAAVSDLWLSEREAAGTRPVTLRGYRSKLKPALEAFGSKRIQTLTRQQIKAHLRTRSHLGISSVRVELYVIRATLATALEDGLIQSNPAVGLKPNGQRPKEREHLTAEAADTITAHVAGDRLEVLWLLSLAGLRRSEVMGLRWSDFTDTTVTVQRGRTDLHRHSTTPTKSAKSERTLPLPAPIAAALRRTRKARAAEVVALGAQWSDDAFVAADQALQPLRPEVYSDDWGRMLSALNLPPVTLHGARHGSVTRMLNSGAPINLVQRWHGHSNPSQTLSYAHAGLDDLATAAAAVWATPEATAAADTPSSLAAVAAGQRNDGAL
jgi:integrase